MMDNVFDHLDGVIAVLLLSWAMVLVWATWQIRCMLRQLAAERREIRRWRRLTQTLEQRNRERL